MVISDLIQATPVTLSDNARTVLERRYLLRDESGAVVETPEEIGTLWGTINREAIHEDIREHYLKPAQERGIPVETLIDRSGRFVELAERFAPHWLAESRAVARAAEVHDTEVRHDQADIDLIQRTAFYPFRKQ